MLYPCFPVETLWIQSRFSATSVVHLCGSEYIKGIAEHRITEILRLEKPSVITESNHSASIKPSS